VAYNSAPAATYYPVPLPSPLPAQESKNGDHKTIDFKELHEQIDPAASDFAAEPPTQEEVMKAFEKAHDDGTSPHVDRTGQRRR
jgi:hypothetical protein